VGGTDASSYGANTTTLASAIKTKWETDLLAKAEGMLVANKFAVSKVMGRGAGGTLRINRLLRPANVTSADTEGYLYDYDDAKQLTSNYLDLTPESWGDSFGFTAEGGIQSFIKDSDNQHEIAGQMARSLEYQLMKTMCTGCLRHLIDKDATMQVSGTADSGDTTSLIDDALTQSDDAWNGGFLTIVNPGGPNYDTTRQVVNFTASSDDVDFTGRAFNHAMTDESKYRMSVGTNLTSSDILTITGLLDCAALHRKLETPKFSGGVYRAFIDAAQERDLNDDSTFTTSASYDNSQRYENYRLGRWLDIEFFVGSEIYRESVAGVEGIGTGAVYVAPIFGPKSYAAVRWGQGQGDFGVKFHYVDEADSGNLRNNMSWISWSSRHARGVLRATSIIGLMTGATSLNVVI